MANEALAHRYRDIAIKTANPIQLIVILYDAAIHALQEAQEHLKKNNIAGRARCINRGLSIMSELQGCLNFKDGGDIAQSLDRLYVYMKQRVFDASVEQKGEPLAEVVGLLENLRSAWRELAVQAQKAGAPPVMPNTGMMSPPNPETQGQRPLNISG